MAWLSAFLPHPVLQPALPPQPLPPPLPPAPPLPHPVASFDFQNPNSGDLDDREIAAGWSQSGEYPWRRAYTNTHTHHNRHTGPLGGPEIGHTSKTAKGFFFYAGGRGVLDLDARPGSTYTLSYDGTACASYGLVGRVSFFYHMWTLQNTEAAIATTRRPLAMGTLNLVALPSRTTLWSKSGNQGDLWHHVVNLTIVPPTHGLAFEYLQADGWGEPAIGDVTVECVRAPSPSPPAPPGRPPRPPLAPAPPMPPPSPPVQPPTQHPPPPTSPPTENTFSMLAPALALLALLALIVLADHLPDLAAAYKRRGCLLACTSSFCSCLAAKEPVAAPPTPKELHEQLFRKHEQIVRQGSIQRSTSGSSLGRGATEIL